MEHGRAGAGAGQGAEQQIKGWPVVRALAGLAGLLWQYAGRPLQRACVKALCRC